MDALNLEATKTKRAGCEPSAQKNVEREQFSPKRTKENVILAALRHGSLNRFEAERIGDHCLHSTVSTLTRKQSLRFDREWERVPTRFGKDVRVKRYRVAASSREVADRILAAAAKDGCHD